MAEKRMFAKTIIDSDAFLDMPMSSRLLYYDLCMRADDDGFVNSPKRIMKLTGATEDDIRVLVLRRFIIPFESGVVVIKHWKIHNYIRKDTYAETICKEEKTLLETDNNKAYKLINEECIRAVDETYTQIRLDKNREDKNRLDKSSIDVTSSEEESSTDDTAKASKKESVKHKYGEYQHVLLKDEELQKLKNDYSNWEELITYLDEYIEMKGYKAKNHYLCIKKWVIDAVKRTKSQSNNTKHNTSKSYQGYSQREYSSEEDFCDNVEDFI